jgi:polyhydroxyalkanoate synthesis regulator phasin
MAEISQFKEINAELERKFLMKIQEMISQTSVFETRETELTNEILILKESNRQL